MSYCVNVRVAFCIEWSQLFVDKTTALNNQMNIYVCVCSTREHVTPEMNKLRQSLRRKKPTYVPEASRPHQWQADEEAVRKGKCNFAVRVRKKQQLCHTLTLHCKD